MTSPLISVIIPCYNTAQYISHALDAMVAQTYKNIEVIIVDDNSTDNLKEQVDPYLQRYTWMRLISLPMIDSYRFDRYGNNINAGWMARNYGVDHARGELITFQDADDGSCANRIEVQYALMQAYNAVHVNVDWQQYHDSINGKVLQSIVQMEDVLTTDAILTIAQTARNGWFERPFGKNEATYPFERLVRKVNRKWFRDWPSYPCAASMPLVRRQVFETCRFRPLWERTMPSLRGRGADCDFNFLVAQTFKQSIAVKMPLVLWRVAKQNPLYTSPKFVPQ